MRRLACALFGLVLYSSPAFSANSLIQCAFGSTASGTSVTATMTVTAGHQGWAQLGSGGVGAMSLGAITRPSGFAVPMGASIDNGGTYQEHSVNYNLAGGSTTFTYSIGGSATFLEMYVCEWSGGANNGFDQTGQSAIVTATTATTGTTPGLSGSTDIAFGTFVMSGNCFCTLNSETNGYTVPMNGNQTGNANAPAVLIENILASNAATSSTATWSDLVTVTGLISTFKASAAVAQPCELLLLGVGQC